MAGLLWDKMSQGLYLNDANFLFVCLCKTNGVKSAARGSPVINGNYPIRGKYHVAVAFMVALAIGFFRLNIHAITTSKQFLKQGRFSIDTVSIWERGLQLQTAILFLFRCNYGGKSEINTIGKPAIAASTSFRSASSTYCSLPTGTSRWPVTQQVFSPIIQTSFLKLPRLGMGNIAYHALGQL